MRSQPQITTACAVCGNTFLVWPYELREGRRFCGKSCANKRQRAMITERLWDKVQCGAESECWPFTGATNAYGYGVLTRGGRGQGHVLAHRLAWELTNGPITGGKLLLHECDNPPCCNPAHLHLGTHSENLREAYARHQR